jgi:hypothetical protein
MRRALKVFAFDPSHGRHLGNHLTVQVPYEPGLEPGPIGQRIAVIDYDGSNKCYYEPVDLNDPSVLLTQGLDPNDADPKFHQQMVYAVAWETVSLFERAIGRSIRWRFARASGDSPKERAHLRIFPHAMQEANAYYDRAQGALMFGYFAHEDDVKAGLPSPRHVFTCASHDIVAHETAHALLDVFRPEYLYSTNADIGAFHEAFADIVALFQHFSVKEALLDTLQRTGGLLHRRELESDAPAGPSGPMITGEVAGLNPLIQLAREFGRSRGSREELRSALSTPPKPDLLAQLMEPHARGSILVAAVFDAFFSVFLRRTRDLMRFARSAGLAGQTVDLHPDLANRLAVEASKVAGHFTRLCVRALDYCPVADLTFGDYLRAIVTADIEAFPDDQFGYRDAIIQAFTARGIRPEGVTSFSEQSLCLPKVRELPPRHALDTLALGKIQLQIDLQRERSTDSRTVKKARQGRQVMVHRYASSRLGILGLARAKVRVGAVARSMREHQDGIPRPQYILCLHQQQEIAAADGMRLKVRGGSTVIAAHDGTLQYVIAKSIKDKARIEAQKEWLMLRLEADPRFEYASRAELAALWQSRQKLDFAMLHRGY